MTEQEEQTTIAILKSMGMTEEEAEQCIVATKQGLKDIAEGRVTPLSQVEAELEEQAQKNQRLLDGEQATKPG